MVLFAAVVGTFFLLLIVGLVVAIPAPSTAQFFVFRIVLALAGAALSTVLLTGSIVVQFQLAHGALVSAGGAFAVFVILYFFSPKLLPVQRRVDQDG